MQLTREVLEGFDCVRVMGGDLKSSYEAYWFDPAHGMALVGHDVVNMKGGQQVVITSFRVKKFAEASPGVWYPIEVYEDVAYPKSAKEGTERYHYRASVVVANDQTFDESVFTPAFPPGCYVNDQVKGISYRVGLAPVELERTLDRMAADISSGQVDAAVLERTADPNSSRAPTAGEPNGQRPIPVAAQADRAHSGTIIFVICLGLCVFVGAVLAIRRGLGRSKTLMLLLTLSSVWCGSRVCLAQNAQSGAPILSGSDPALVFRDNCGLDVSYLTLKLFGISVPAKQLAREIGAGETFANETSLLSLKKAFDEHGLCAAAYKADSPAEILGYLDSKAVILLRLERNAYPKPIYHFCAIKLMGEDIAFLDPPRKPRKFPRNAFPSALQPAEVTGEFLVVSRPSQGLIAGPAIVVDKATVDLGSIPLTTTEFKGEAIFRNIGSSPLHILKVATSCSCMKEIYSDKEIQPGQTGRVSVLLEKSRLSPGQNLKSVQLATDDPNNQVVRVSFSCFVQALPKQEDVRLFPQNVDFGRALGGDMQKKVVPLSIVIPKDPQHEFASLDVTCSSPLFKITRQNQAEADRFAEGVLDPNSATTATYILTWQRTPEPGYFNGEVEFAVKQAGLETRTFKVLIRGEALARIGPVGLDDGNSRTGG